MATDVQTCYRHPDRRAGVRCQRCDRPICPHCMTQASVGFHCPACAREGRQRVVSGRQLRTQPVVTMALVAANLAVFVADAVSRGNLSSELGEWGRQGALYGPAVAAGDWWRPVTGGFLHAGLWHVALNMFLLWQLGGLLEPAVRPLRFAALYLVALLGGSFLVLVISPDSVTVGASGAVFGLMGAAFVAMRSRGIDPFATGIGPLILINLMLRFAIPRISVGGHIGGLLAGGLAGLILWEWAPRLPPRSPLPLLTLAALGGALFAGCLVMASASG